MLCDGRRMGLQAGGARVSRHLYWPVPLGGQRHSLGAAKPNLAPSHFMNRWSIPPDLEDLVAARDRDCIYCRRPFAGIEGARGHRRSWEHIINDQYISTEQNIALCCISCNSSKGAKTLLQWLESKFCARRGINAGTIAEVARNALNLQAKSSS